jgi:phosphonatase-like hydrolase
MDGTQLVVFDLAGTTIKDSGHVPHAFLSALVEHGIDVTFEQVRAVRGASKRDAIWQFIPEAPNRDGLAASAYAAFRRHLERLYQQERVEPVEGAEQLFTWLRDRGVRVAITTGFDRDITTMLLAALRWDGRFIDAVVCGDEVPRGRPAPYLIFRAIEAAGATGVQHVVNVGDTVLDLEAGRNAGVRWNVGVLTGAHDRAALEQAPHTHILQSIGELGGLWKG